MSSDAVYSILIAVGMSAIINGLTFLAILKITTTDVKNRPITRLELSEQIDRLALELARIRAEANLRGSKNSDQPQ